MSKLLRVVLLAGVVVTLAAGMATAERQASIEPVGEVVPVPISLGYTSPGTSCQIGNLNPAAWVIYSWLLPPEDYKLIFDPRTTCTACPLGFKVTKIHVFYGTKVACSVVMSVDLERAVLQSAGCYAPGPVLCQTGTYQVNFAGAGLWDVGIPVAVSNCPACPINGCFFMSEGPYCLSMHIVSKTTAWSNIGLATDAGPAVLCTNWNNYGFGWEDLLVAEPAWPGQLKFFADAECCEFPSAVEDGTWGCIKSLYR